MKAYKVIRIIIESIFLIVYVACLAAMVVYMFAAKEQSHKVMFGILSFALSGLIYEWILELVKTIERKK